MRRRLLLGYLTITVVVLLVLEVPLGLAYAGSERRRLLADVQHDALALSIRTHEAIEPAAPATLARIVGAYAVATGGRVVVTDATGRLLVDSDPTPGTRPDRSFASRPEFARALAGREADGTRHSDTLGTDLLYVAVPVVSGGEVIGALRVSYPTSFVTARIRRVWLGLAALAVCVLGIVFLVSLRLARAVSAPVSDLEVAARRLGDGDLGARAPVPRGPDELRVLAESFNGTAARLGSLVESQRAFVADASHQLRTPLQALRLRLEILEGDAAAGRPVDARDVEGALAEVRRLSRLVDGLLALARAEQGGAAPVALGLTGIVAGRLDAWRAFAAEQGIEVASTVPGSLEVRVTPGSLEQALDNLISNAIDVAPAGSAVRCDARADGPGHVVLTIRDQGPGMTAEQLDRAFDRFWRPPGASPGGSGLWLALVRGLVEADGGSVDLAAAEGGGLEARVRLRSA
ncbi:MAG: ATP-binding protein [Actinomycetes bacterium]